MKKSPQKISNAVRILCALVLLFVSILPALMPSDAHAAQITTRSLTLIGVGSDGGSKPGGVVNHSFTFTLPSSGLVGSVKFEYCMTAANSVAVPACVTPEGLLTTSATIPSGTVSGLGAGWTLNNTTNGAPYITNASPPTVTGPQVVTVQLNSVTNPLDTALAPPNDLYPNGMTFFVRITSYTGTNGSTGPVDAGTVAAATTNPIILTGTMPESLVFCAAQTVGLTGGVPDCGTATSGAVTFDNLFSPTITAVAESMMAASTNAGLGYIITVNGATMQSGGNSINAMNTLATSVKNTSQFGLNLVADTASASANFPGSATPYLSANVAPNFGAGNYKGAPYTGYDTIDSFKFTTGDTVARTDNGPPHSGALAPSDSQIYTVSYIVNVPGSQAAGTYTTTLTYICTATF
jgi:hypothetical protein